MSKFGSWFKRMQEPCWSLLYVLHELMFCSLHHTAGSTCGACMESSNVLCLGSTGLRQQLVRNWHGLVGFELFMQAF